MEEFNSIRPARCRPGARTRFGGDPNLAALMPVGGAGQRYVKTVHYGIPVGFLRPSKNMR